MNDNKIKSINGAVSKGTVVQLLQKLQSSGYVEFCSSDYRNGYQEYDANQFFAPFYIEFINGEAWLIFTSNSIRNDRMNNQQWNSYHLRIISPNIKKAYLVMPDDILDNAKELRVAIAYNEKIKVGNMFSSIDAVLTQTQLYEKIISYAKKIKQSKMLDSVGCAYEPRVNYGDISISIYSNREK